MTRYKDIIGLSRPDSKYPPMDRRDRAAQFSPFAALRGFGEAIAEKARFTEKRPELSDQARVLLDRKLDLLEKNLHQRPLLILSYFKEDEKKSGGQRLKARGKLRKLDKKNSKIHLEDGRVIDLEDVLEIELDFSVNT